MYFRNLRMTTNSENQCVIGQVKREISLRNSLKRCCLVPKYYTKPPLDIKEIETPCWHQAITFWKRCSVCAAGRNTMMVWEVQSDSATPDCSGRGGFRWNTGSKQDRFTVELINIRKTAAVVHGDVELFVQVLERSHDAYACRPRALW